MEEQIAKLREAIKESEERMATRLDRILAGFKDELKRESVRAKPGSAEPSSPEATTEEVEAVHGTTAAGLAPTGTGTDVPVKPPPTGALDVNTSALAAPTPPTCSTDGSNQVVAINSVNKVTTVCPDLAIDLNTTTTSLTSSLTTPSLLPVAAPALVNPKIMQQGQVLRPLPWPSFQEAVNQRIELAETQCDMKAHITSSTSGLDPVAGAIQVAEAPLPEDVSPAVPMRVEFSHSFILPTSRRRSTKGLAHKDDWVQPMPTLSNFSPTCVPPKVVYVDPAGPLRHMSPTVGAGHGVHAVDKSRSMSLSPVRMGIEQQPWPPPVPVQIAVNDIVMFYGIARGCVTSDSGCVWWPPDHQSTMKSEVPLMSSMQQSNSDDLRAATPTSPSATADIFSELASSWPAPPHIQGNCSRVELRPLPGPSFEYSQVRTLWHLEKFLDNTCMPKFYPCSIACWEVLLCLAERCDIAYNCKHLVHQVVGGCPYAIRRMGLFPGDAFIFGTEECFLENGIQLTYICQVSCLYGEILEETAASTDDFNINQVRIPHVYDCLVHKQKKECRARELFIGVFSADFHGMLVLIEGIWGWLLYLLGNVKKISADKLGHELAGEFDGSKLPSCGGLTVCWLLNCKDSSETIPATTQSEVIRAAKQATRWTEIKPRRQVCTVLVSALHKDFHLASLWDSGDLIPSVWNYHPSAVIQPCLSSLSCGSHHWLVPWFVDAIGLLAKWFSAQDKQVFCSLILSIPIKLIGFDKTKLRSIPWPSWKLQFLVFKILKCLGTFITSAAAGSASEMTRYFDTRALVESQMMQSWLDLDIGKGMNLWPFIQLSALQSTMKLRKIPPLHRKFLSTEEFERGGSSRSNIRKIAGCVLLVIRLTVTYCCCAALQSIIGIMGYELKRFCHLSKCCPAALLGLQQPATYLTSSGICGARTDQSYMKFVHFNLCQDWTNFKVEHIWLGKSTEMLGLLPGFILRLLLHAPRDPDDLTSVVGGYMVSASDQEHFQGGRGVIAQAAFLDQAHASHNCYIDAFLGQGCCREDYYHIPVMLEEVQAPWDPGESVRGYPLKLRLGDKPSFKEGGMLGTSPASTHTWAGAVG